MTNHMGKLRDVAEEDLRHLDEKERTYGGSWKKRGGVGAFMMLARKWDRIENMLEKTQYDIFGAIESDPTGRDGSALAEVRDLRRYLLLVESEMVARGTVEYKTPQRVMREELLGPGTPEDGGHYATEHRHPINATYAEFNSFKDSDIPHGPAKGDKWYSLYQLDTSDGRYKMRKMYWDVYGDA